MAEWSETTLRSAAAWKAFKEGKALFENGAVSGAKAGSDSFTGTVRDGKRVFKAAVKVISATNLDTRCACFENQSTGALCPHGIAVGLAILNSGTASETKPAPVAAPKQIASFAISLPVNWLESLRKGRLSATLSAGRETTPADERIAAWLLAAGQKLALPIHLNLDAKQSAEFLRCATDHPNVQVNKTQDSLEIHEGARVAIERLDRRDHTISIEADSSGLVRLGDDWWRISGNEISRIGLGAVDAGLAKLLDDLAGSGKANVSIVGFLEGLERWQEWLDLPENSWLDAIHFVPAPASFELMLDGTLQRLEATLRVRYFNEPPVVPGRGQVRGLPKISAEQCEVRDWNSEREAVAELENSLFKSSDPGNGKWALGSETAIIDFLSKRLPRLQKSWKVTESDRFKLSRKQVAIVDPKIQILGSGEDWLSFDLSFLSTDGSVIPAADIRRMLAGGRGASGKKLVISDDVSNLIEPLFADLELRQEGGHFVCSKRAGEVITEIRNKLDNQLAVSDSSVVESLEIADSITATLRPYQTKGLNWLLDRSSRFGGALLADDMGLGKTIQTIACVERVFQDADQKGMILVIATASLLGNWKAEFRKFAPTRAVRILHGTGREAQQKAAQDGEVLLTTFGTLPRDLAWYLKRKFKAVIVDEASLMRNPDTDHAKAIAKLDSNVRIALTGTPIENGVRDLWSIFRFVQPGWLGSREDFKERYEMSTGDPRAMERLRLKTSPFMLRRTKEEVAPELPSKIFIEEYCDLTTEQQSVYRDLLSEGRKKVDSLKDTGNTGAARMQVLTALLRLRQTCCDLALLGNERFNQMAVTKRSAKLQRLLELMDEAVAGGHKMLVFSQFQTQLREIEKCVIERGFTCLKLDGQTRKRQEMVDQFQSAGGPPIFLISLKAGGYGLNLTAADMVVHFDPWWNPAAEAQATDRAHRIGQTRPVTVYRLITRGTVEEKVVSLQNKKRQIAASVDESGAGDVQGWSENELIDLIQS